MRGVRVHPRQPRGRAAPQDRRAWCRRLALGPDTRLVEIGSGWGGLALHAASEYGTHVTTTTLSAAQHEWVEKRIAGRGLEDRVVVLDRDYHDLHGTFDRLVSIEMIEAVDWRQYGDYFGTCARLLTPDGLAGIQAIVIADQRYERAKSSEDYIRRWIFLGGCLPSVSAITESLTRATDLRVVSLHDIGAHYAETLRRWRHNLNEQAGALPDIGLDAQFRRMFEFYLAYCEGAFRERHVSVVQLVLAAPMWRGDLSPSPTPTPDGGARA